MIGVHHVWIFAEVEDGVPVTSEKTLTVAQGEVDGSFSTAALGAGLTGWLHDLKGGV